MDVQSFTAGKSFKRTLKRNADLLIETKYAVATDEQFDLLQRYLNHRHAGGGMSSMDFDRYSMMVEECASETEITEFRNQDGTLIAAMLIDHLTDGMSLVYSFFDPNEEYRSLGNFMILTHIELCRAQDLPYLYLGYWVPDSPKMSYKVRFKPAEILTYVGWKKIPKTQKETRI